MRNIDEKELARLRALDTEMADLVKRLNGVVERLEALVRNPRPPASATPAKRSHLRLEGKKAA